MAMKAIETYYSGYLFRSRREARWAVCLDALGIHWLYEPEGYQFNNGDKYLPDFLLPDPGLWVEVKGTAPELRELEKATRLAQGDPGRSVILTWENFDWQTCQDNIMFGYDERGVFHSEQGRWWLENAPLGWLAARSARFEHGADGTPLWRNAEPLEVMYGRLPF